MLENPADLVLGIRTEPLKHPVVVFNDLAFLEQIRHANVLNIAAQSQAQLLLEGLYLTANVIILKSNGQQNQLRVVVVSVGRSSDVRPVKAPVFSSFVRLSDCWSHG